MQISRWLGSRSLNAAVAALAVSIIGLVVLGFRYWHQADYWLVAVPGFGTAIGTVGLAAATFRLLQRQDAEREMTLTALDHSQVMATEAARQRRDARARLLRISAWQRIQAHLDSVSDDGLKDGQTFDLPADGQRRLLVSQVFQILAADGEPMSVTLNGLVLHRKMQNGMETVRVPLTVGPGVGPSIAWFTVDRSVAEWVNVYQQRQAGDPGDEAYAYIGVDDGFDDGVVDTYLLMQAGCPIRPSGQRDGQWVLDLSGPDSRSGLRRIAFVERPMTRHYFLSKIGNQPLADA